MNVRRLLFATLGAVVKATGVGLQSAPTLVVVDHLYLAPFGPRLEQELDAMAHGSWPSDFFPAELQALAGSRAKGMCSEIQAARMPRSRQASGETG
jgi:hypothetical protein